MQLRIYKQGELQAIQENVGKMSCKEVELIAEANKMIDRDTYYFDGEVHLITVNKEN